MLAEFELKPSSERESLQEQLANVLVFCGYDVYDSVNSKTDQRCWEFIRITDDRQKSFPRFHLTVREEKGNLQAEFHLDLRPNSSLFIGEPVSAELKRLIQILSQDDSLSFTPYVFQLKNALIGALLFGAGEKAKEFNPHNFSRIHSKKAKGLAREILLKKKYASLNKEDVFDVDFGD